MLASPSGDASLAGNELARTNAFRGEVDVVRFLCCRKGGNNGGLDEDEEDSEDVEAGLTLTLALAEEEGPSINPRAS